uniref:Uncharacterized protein n=1 Tax=Timema poppense TaxID=170557 RepID=A0A7R9CI13_TIMPO|nr:unnamed protein product [Timema poppensis]
MPSKSNKTVVSELEFQASQVIGRLEEAVEKAEDGSSKGQVWKNSHGFLPIPSKSSDEILGLLEPPLHLLGAALAARSATMLRQSAARKQGGAGRGSHVTTTKYSK